MSSFEHSPIQTLHQNDETFSKCGEYMSLMLTVLEMSNLSELSFLNRFVEVFRNIFGSSVEYTVSD